jgi:Protein of unknown function (DUF2516)
VFSHGLSVLGWLLTVLAFAAFVVEAWAFGDAISRPAKAFPATGKQTKRLWMLILGVATVVGLGSALLQGAMAATAILPVAAFVAAGIYFADVRPKVREFGRGGTSSGPYGPW